MADNLRLPEIDDLDRVSLEEQFRNAGAASAIAFGDAQKTGGSAGILDPISATVIVSGMALTVLAIWICREKKRDMKIQNLSDHTEFVITASESSGCKGEVLRQLVKLFPNVKID